MTPQNFIDLLQLVAICFAFQTLHYHNKSFRSIHRIIDSLINKRIGDRSTIEHELAQGDLTPSDPDSVEPWPSENIRGDETK